MSVPLCSCVCTPPESRALIESCGGAAAGCRIRPRSFRVPGIHTPGAPTNTACRGHTRLVHLCNPGSGGDWCGHWGPDSELWQRFSSSLRVVVTDMRECQQRRLHSREVRETSQDPEGYRQRMGSFFMPFGDFARLCRVVKIFPMPDA